MKKLIKTLLSDILCSVGSFCCIIELSKIIKEYLSNKNITLINVVDGSFYIYLLIFFIMLLHYSIKDGGEK